MNEVFEPDYYWKLIRFKINGVTEMKAWLGLNSVENTDTKPASIEVDVAHLKEMIREYYPALQLDF